MARGTHFLDLVTRVKNDTGRSNAVNVGVDDLPRVKEAINTVYAILYLDHDWRHLRKKWTLPLAAGQRYYDFPSGLNPERVEYAKLRYGTIVVDLDFGIDDHDYAIHDSDDDDRSEPALKWDVRFTDPHEQLEIWPIPSTSTQSVRFKGIQAAPRLVDDDDQCLLDDTLVVLAASAYLEKDEKERAKKDAATARHLGILKGMNTAGVSGVRVGLGQEVEKAKRTAIVRVA